MFVHSMSSERGYCDERDATEESASTSETTPTASLYQLPVYNLLASIVPSSSPRTQDEEEEEEPQSDMRLTTPSPKQQTHPWDEELSNPTQLHRVGASIGHKSPTLHTLLSDHIPGVFVDEEDGILGMFSEIQKSLPTQQVYDAYRQTLARFWQYWNQIQIHCQEASSNVSRVLPDDDIGLTQVLTDDEIGLTAMMKEIAQSSMDGIETAQELMDAVLARILHTVYQAKVAAYDAAREFPEKLSPTPSGPIADDVSLRGMFRELSQQWPGTLDEDDAERYMIGKLQRISEESSNMVETMDSQDSNQDMTFNAT